MAKFAERIIVKKVCFYLKFFKYIVKNVFFFNWLFSETVVLSFDYVGISEFKLLFQDAMSPMMEGIVRLHHDVMIVVFVIVIFVGWSLSLSSFLFHYTKTKISQTFIHGTVLEIVWTIVPSLVLVVIAVPTFALLYAMDEGVVPVLTLKAVGHQWFWTYEYSDFVNFSSKKILSYEVSCFMVPTENLEEAYQFRLLETDHAIFLPVDTHVRVIVTAVDVLHCWAVPSLGLKIDACPGRLNQILLYINKEGVFYGQCSEICGANHAFMPVMLFGVRLEEFYTWLITACLGLFKLIQ